MFFEKQLLILKILFKQHPEEVSGGEIIEAGRGKFDPTIFVHIDYGDLSLMEGK